MLRVHGTDVTTAPRLTAPERRDDDADGSLRPLVLAEFIGQRQARANLQVFIGAAKARGEALDHVLFVGPPGLGKTTLAQIVARELGVNFRSTSGPVIAKAGDLAAQLTNLEERDVLFIDEIHRLNPAVEEILYPAMEDYQLDLIIGEGPAARSVKIELPKFTLVGATTRAGLLTTPLRDRFGIPIRLEFYDVDELEQIVKRGARVLGIGMSEDGANEIAKRSRGTPAHRRAAAAARARLRPRRGRRRGDAARSPTAPCAFSTSIRSASTRWTASTSPPSRPRSAAARSASRPWRRRCRSRATPSRRSSSPSSSSAASCSARRAGGCSRRTPSAISACPSRAAMRSSSGCSGEATAMREEWPHLAGRLEGGAHVLPVRVYYEDTDFSGVVYHASYLRFLERGRTDFLRLGGVDQSTLHAAGEGVIFAVRRMTVDFLKPARMDDILIVQTRTAEVRGASLVIAQAIRRGDETLLTADVRVAAIAGGRPARISDDLRGHSPTRFRGALVTGY